MALLRCHHLLDMLLTLRKKTARLADHIVRSLPHFCALCHSPGSSGLCDSCQKRYFTGDETRCRQCAHQLTESKNDVRLCGVCLKRSPAFDQTITAADYVPPIDQLVQSLKFGSRLDLAPLFATLMDRAIQKNSLENTSYPTILAPVPLSNNRLITRGFNQALEIAKPLSHQRNIPLMPHLIERIRDTPPQTVISLKERRRNTRGAFVINAAFKTQIQGAHIAIVDDVLTTGETMGELARLLKQAGAAQVSGFVFARTPL